jgi:hypothetical protein
LVPAAPAGPEYYSLASSLSIGAVDTLAAGGSATASITGLAPSQVLSLGIPVGVTGPQGTNGSLMEPSVQQFAADGSVLRNLPARVIGAEQLLKQAVWWIDSAHSSASGQSVTNLGWGGTALNAQLGSAGSADSNDPRYLDWDGENYVYLPGVASNFLSVPDEAALDITGDIDIRVRVALDDWTPATSMYVVAKRLATTDIGYSMQVVATTGRLRLSWSADGTTGNANDSTVSPTVADGDPLWVRATRDRVAGEVKFYTSADGVTWDQLGTTVTGANTDAIFNSTQPFQVGQAGTNQIPLAGKVFRVVALSGIDGTPVLDVDCSQIGAGSATSFAALTGQTVTVNRSTSGRKTVAVTHPLWLLGTDDYLEVADNDLIDFGATDSFTVLAVVRQWAATGNDTLVAKKDGDAASDVGWVLRTNASAEIYFAVADGTLQDIAETPATYGALVTAVGVRSLTPTVTITVNGVTAVDASPQNLATLINSDTLRIGRMSGAGTAYADMEFVAAAVFRRALTAGEITTITNYYSARIGA